MIREHYQLTATGFRELYERKLKNSSSYRKAYQQAENDHISKFNSPRYGGYESFRQYRDRNR